MRHAVSLPARSTSPTPECCSLSSSTYPGEPDERGRHFALTYRSRSNTLPRKSAKTLTTLPCRRLHVSGLAYYCILGKLATTSSSSTVTASRGPCHRLRGPSPTPLVQPPLISSTALPLISPAKRSRICELYTPSAHFVTSEGHVLWRRLGILNCQVRSHRPRPRPQGGHPRRFFQGETSHL